MNHLMSNEAVYRTAPATPGLLKIIFMEATKSLLGLKASYPHSQHRVD